MKTIGAFIIAMVLITSCSEETKDEIKDLLPSMSATIDGEKWVTSVRATVEKDGFFIITGTALTGETLIVTIKGTSTGLYELKAPLKTQCMIVYKEDVNTELEGALGFEGSVNLTDVNTTSKNISGTFEFKILKDGNTTMNVTDGVFSKVNYTVSGS